MGGTLWRNNINKGWRGKVINKGSTSEKINNESYHRNVKQDGEI
jgi:hypothetical protein